jgi:S-phase kinase-associated protein 1
LKWRNYFLAKLSVQSIIDIVLATNYLNFKDLLDLTCAKVASLMIGKTTEEIRETFSIPSDEPSASDDAGEPSAAAAAAAADDS